MFVCGYLSVYLCVYLWYKAPERFACRPHLISFLAMSDPATAASPLNDAKGNVVILSLVSGQGEEKLLPAVSFPEDPWMNLPFVSSSSVYSPVQQLPADPGHQENR